MQIDHTCSPGDRVQLLHTEEVGEVMTIQHGRATIRFEYITFTVCLREIQPVTSKSTIHQSISKSLQANNSLQLLYLDQFLDFNPELDLHGLKIPEAIQVLDKWIDQGLVTGHQHLRIIHGKGKGLLRQEVRRYLKTHQLVRKIIDNHPFPGGSGVTCIEL